MQLQVKQMNTESLFSASNNLTVHRINKKFYGQYLYKLVFRLKGCRVLKYYDDETFSAKEKFSNSYIIGWYRSRGEVDSDQIDLLYSMRQMHIENPNLKYRIEEPSLSYYFNSVDEISKFVTEVIPPAAMPYLRRYYRPDPNDINSFDDDTLYSAYANKYTHLVHFRDLSVSNSGIFDYLTGIRNQIRITDKDLQKFKMKDGFSHSVVYSARMYVNDLGFLTFLNLIHPRCIRKVYQLKKRAK